MNPLANELNKILDSSVAGRLFSQTGRRFFFPRGIVSQSAEAVEHAHRYNATVGMARKDQHYLNLPAIREMIPGLSTEEIFPYAPTPGEKELRNLWLKEMIKKNPSLKGKPTTLPLVTSGITHGVSIAASLFINPGDEIIVPDMFWGNYNLIGTVFNGGVLRTFPFFAEDRFNLVELSAIIRSKNKGDKAVLILNFPNNPTGYTPDREEAEKLVQVIREKAEEGVDFLIICDDAYFSLYYEKKTFRESFFALLADLHENILAVKLDGATKEDFAWGFRLGFITYAARGLTEEQREALTLKTMGMIRATVSNSNKLGQSLLIHALNNADYETEKKDALKVLESKYAVIKKLLAGRKGNSRIAPLPFNSGYFLCFKLAGVDAEKLRLYLLHQRGVGTIAVTPEYLRIAYACVEENDLEALLDEIYQAVEKLAS